MVVGPTPWSRRRRTGAVAVVLLLALLSILTRSAPQPPCDNDPEAGTRPWLNASDPQVRDLSASVLDRPRTTRDALPPSSTALVSVDIRQSSRLLFTTESIRLYLAGGPGFLCLIAVDAGSVLMSPAASSCILNTSVVNSGLWLDLARSSSGPHLLVVLLPDGYHLGRLPSSAHLVAEGPNAVALAGPSTGVVLVPSRGHPSVRLNSNGDFSGGSGWGHQALSGCRP